jgi:hypothetical protein
MSSSRPWTKASTHITTNAEKTRAQTGAARRALSWFQSTVLSRQTPSVTCLLITVFAFLALCRWPCGRGLLGIVLCVVAAFLYSSWFVILRGFVRLCCVPCRPVLLGRLPACACFPHPSALPPFASLHDTSFHALVHGIEDVTAAQQL